MAKNPLQAGEVVSGNHGIIYWDGEPIWEVEAFEATLSTNRTEIQFAKKMGQGSKVTSTTGEGSMTLKKVYSRGIRRFVEAFKAGRDPISTLTALLDDPAAVGEQNERITFDTVWFSELPLASFEQGDYLTTEISFGFDPDDVDVQEEIQ